MNSSTTYNYTPDVDDALRHIYESGGGTLKELARRVGIPESSLAWRAKKIGLPRMQVRNPWTPEEEAIIRRNIHHSYKHVHRMIVRAGYKRTLISVRRKIENDRLRNHRHLMTTGDVALAMGVDKKVVAGWIDKGLLKGKIKDLARQADTSHIRLIRPEDVREFIRQNPLKFDLRKVDQLWFLDLVFGSIGSDEPTQTPLTPEEMDRNEFGYDETHS